MFSLYCLDEKQTELYATYAVMLCNMGEPDRGLSALRKYAKTVKKYNSDPCSDYAAIQGVRMTL